MDGVLTPSARLAARPVVRLLLVKTIRILTFVVADALALLLSFALACFIRRDVMPFFLPSVGPMEATLRDYAGIAWMASTFPVFFALEGLYVRRRAFWVEVAHLYSAIMFSTGFFLAALAMTAHSTDVSRSVVAISLLLMFAVAPLARYAAKSLLFGLGLWRKRVLIVGATPSSRMLAENLARDPFLGYEVAGFLDDELSPGSAFAGRPVLGPVDDLADALERSGSADVIVSLPTRESMERALSLCEDHAESVRVIPDMLGFGLAGAEVEVVAEVPIISMNYNLRKPWNRALKAGFDRLLGLLILVALLPLLAIIAVLVAIGSRGPVIFSQRRVGPGYGFEFHKFRTMFLDGDARLAAYLATRPDKQQEWDTYLKLRGYDPRVTWIGRLLRRTSLDELPQLWNVVRGDMSLVGPRPYLPDEIERMGPDPDRVVATILIARPGLTGLWQVSGRNEVPFEARIRMDFHYVRNWSFWLDLVILWKTIWVVLARKGAY